MVGLAIGLLSLLTGAYFHLKSKRVRRALYRQEEHPVVGTGGLSEVEIRYQGQVVPHVSRAAVTFWNGGTETINREDVAPADPLRIEMPEGSRLLDAHVSARTRDVTQCDVVVDDDSPTSVGLSFDFLDPGDGLTVNMLHTGQADHVVVVRGTIKGTDLERDDRDHSREGSGSELVIGAVMGGAIVPAALAVVLLIEPADLVSNSAILVLLGGVGVASLLTAPLTIESLKRRSRFRVPNELKDM